MAAGITVTGARELAGVLVAAASKLDVQTKTAAVTAGALVETAVKEQLRRTSHPKRTPTPSAPGEPPSLVTGNLMRSIAVRGPTGGLGAYAVAIGPTAIYGRIQELGGITGRGRRTKLPARPYVDPAVTESYPKVAAAFVAAVTAIF